MTPRVTVASLAELQAAFGKVFETHASRAIATHEKFIVALPGGSAARAFLPVLAGLDVDWTRVEIFWIDERAVPPDHPESNYALAVRLLLGPARVPLNRIHRMSGELPDLDAAARRAADELKSIAGDPPHLDLALVGVGEDGHVASIFRNRSAHQHGSAGLQPRQEPLGTAGRQPRQEPLGSAGRQPRQEPLGSAGLQPCHEPLGSAGLQPCPCPPVEPVYDSPKPPSRRLTLTLPVLAGAGLVVVAAFGSSKADVVRAALSRSDAVTPIAELLRRADSALVLLDPDAGLS